MIPVILLLSVLWSIRIIGNVVSFAHLWWVKEYRWDRMLIHLRTPQGKRIYILPWKRPRISPKSLFLVASSLLCIFAFIFYSGLPALVAFGIADVASFPLTFVLVGMINMPVAGYHWYVIARARRMLRAHTPLTVVGITGSYGKTSTKDYVSTIVSAAYKTLKTAASKNAPIGISEVVISALRPDHDVFVVEMGAYKPGEIAFMSKLVRPEIAIITAINEQHQDLFGTIENTMKAKYELIANLTGRRIAILNADDTRVRIMGTWAKRDGVTVWWYGTKQNVPKGAKNFRATDIGTDSHGIYFTCVCGAQKKRVTAPVIGTHQVQNILASVAAAVAVGMPFEDALHGVSHLVPAPHVLERIPGIDGMTLIDDSFNNNPDAAKAALDVLALGSPKRVLVFQPMIELGSYAVSAHEDVGAYAAGMCDAIVLTNANWEADFLRGVRRVNTKIPVTVAHGAKAALYIRTFVSGGGTVLGKGKESAGVLRLLRKEP